MKQDFPATKDVVLIGGGHTHALVLRMWAMQPVAGARLTLINPGPTAPYSGMLPGFVAGHYAREDLDIDLVRLARFAGARLGLGAADHIDLERRNIHVPGRPPIGFDLASIDIGITSAMPAIPGFAEHAVPAKPLGRFASAWEAYLQGEGPASMVVIGGGVAGAELAAAMAHGAGARGRAVTCRIFEAGQAFSALRPGTAEKLRAALAGLGVDLNERAPVAEVAPNAVILDNGDEVPANFIVGAAGAQAYPWLAQTKLALEQGYVTVGPDLRSSDPSVFAVGDCAHLGFDPRPKAGVYAVRQAPVLLHNLRAALTGGALREYRPQRDYLKLISLGGKRALAERFGLTPEGAMMWRWKDRIDQRFMQQFRDLPGMAPPALPRDRTADLAEVMGPKPMCGGCGAKVASGALGGVLAGLPMPVREDVSPLPGDDAGLLVTGGQKQVLTTDHLRAVTEDPVVMARIAAHHALGDIWAMGATPQAATANLILPRQSAALQARQLSEIMQAASEVLREAGADIIGGHSSLGDGLTIGFSITGLLERAPITLAGARPGDRLILTKPIGSGTIMAAEMGLQAPGADVASCLEAMQQGQGAASHCLSKAHAMTDVTGFGLAGHLKNICIASGVTVVIRASDVPLLPGAAELAAAGVRSTLYPDNRAAVPEVPDSIETALLFDPQTSGGLLAAVPPDQAVGLLSGLIAKGYRAAEIGWIETGPAEVRLA